MIKKKFKMKEKDFKVLVNLLINYNKKEKKFPKWDKLVKYNETYQSIFPYIKDKKDINKIYIWYMDAIINKWGSKFRTELLKIYKKNRILFERFIVLNIFQEDKKSFEFQAVWDEFKAILDLDELKNKVLWWTEWWKFKQFSSSTATKIDDWLLEIFPFYNSIWVIIK